MEILFSYNIITVVILCVAALFIFGLGSVVTEACISDERKAKEKAGDDTPVDEACHWRSYRRVTTAMFSIALVIAAWCVYDNYGVRAVAKAFEPAAIELAAAIDDAAKRPFDQRCQFNGHSVPADWIASDSYPCADFGGYRLWKNSQTVVSKYNAADGSKIFIGKPEGADITKVATYDPQGSGRPGLYHDVVPYVNAGTDPVVIRGIASAIRNSLR